MNPVPGSRVEARGSAAGATSIGLPPLRHRLRRGASWSLIGRIVVGVTALGVNTVVARLLKPDALAAYFLTFSVVTVAAASNSRPTGAAAT